MIRHIGIAAGFCAAALGIAGDTLQVGGPGSGVVFDPEAQNIRLVTGVPGASLLGNTLSGQIDRAEIAPNGKIALAVKAGQLYAISGLSGANPAWTRIAPNPQIGAQGIDRIV